MKWPVNVSSNYLFDTKQVFSRCDLFDDFPFPQKPVSFHTEGDTCLGIKEQGVACLV